MIPDLSNAEVLAEYLKLDVDLAGEEEPRETTRGLMDLTKLHKRVIIDRNDKQRFVAIEYRMPGEDEIIRRDLHGHLYTPMVFAEGVAASLPQAG